MSSSWSSPGGFVFHFTDLIKRNRAVKSHVPRNLLQEHLMGLLAHDRDHAGMNQHEHLPENNAILWQSNAIRRILKDLGVARSGSEDQPLAGLPDCKNCEPIALLLGQLVAKFIIAIDDSGERSSDSRRVLPEMSNAVESEKTESCKEQAQPGWRALAAEDLSDRQLRCVVIIEIDCVIHHAKGKWKHKK